MTAPDPAAPPPTEPAAQPSVTRRVEVDAPPEEVFDAIATDEGRERWLDDDPEREIHVESADGPGRMVGWGGWADGPAPRVEFTVIARPGGSRVVVTETVPQLPTAELARAGGAVRPRPLPLVALADAFAAVAA